MNKNVIINFLLFQIGWFACVLGAAKQNNWPGVGFLVVFMLWHFSQAKIASKELSLVLIAVLIGGVFDQIMTQNNLLTYQAHSFTALPPAWILALWAEFAMTLNVSLRWMKNIKSRGKYWVATLFGAIGGPLAYMGAAKLGAVSLDNLPASYIALGLGWALITPALVRLAQQFDGFKAVD